MCHRHFKMGILPISAWRALSATATFYLTPCTVLFTHHYKMLNCHTMSNIDSISQTNRHMSQISMVYWASCSCQITQLSQHQWPATILPVKHHSTESGALYHSSVAVWCWPLGPLLYIRCTAAFDCVDHDLLLQRPHLSFGITGTSLAWISFLSDRTYQLAFGGELSTTHLSQYGVPQRSV